MTLPKIIRREFTSFYVVYEYEWTDGTRYHLGVLTARQGKYGTIEYVWNYPDKMLQTAPFDQNEMSKFEKWINEAAPEIFNIYAERKQRDSWRDL